MGNTITDQLGMARRSHAKGFLRFPQTLKALSYCDQIVFQDGQMIDKVDFQGKAKISVNYGNTIVCVKHDVYPYQLVGTITTKDNYLKAYELSIEITISDSTSFACAYECKEDPAGLAIKELKEAFERYARKYEHNKLCWLTLNLGEWSETCLGNVGVHIEQKGTLRSRSDPYHTEMALWERNRKSQEAKLRAEQEIQQLQDEIEEERKARLKDEERQATAKQREFERQEKTKDQLHEISAKLRKVAAEEIEKVLKERIIEGFARGYKPGEISHEYFALVGIFQGQQKHTEVDKSIIKAATSVVEGSIHSPVEPNTQSPMRSTSNATDDSTP